jgi:hypothetical protein
MPGHCAACAQTAQRSVQYAASAASPSSSLSQLNDSAYRACNPAARLAWIHLADRIQLLGDLRRAPSKMACGSSLCRPGGNCRGAGPTGLSRGLRRLPGWGWQHAHHHRRDPRKVVPKIPPRPHP